MKYDTIIIGGGVSGLGAAIYAGRFAMKTALISENIGGTIVNAPDVANYPGFKNITGIDLSTKIHEHAKDYDIEFIAAKVTKVEKIDDGFKVIASDKEMETKTLIFSNGTEWRKLNVSGEVEFTGKGVHYCALCDGPFYKDKVLGIVGGSDSAAKEALLLSEYAKKVYIIYRKENIRAEPVTTKKVEENQKIEIINNANVKEIKGNQFVNKIILDRKYNSSDELALDGLFIAIGHIALSDLAKNIGVDLNEKGEIKIDRQAKTNVDGVFAAGDVVDTAFKQAITGVAEGVTAAYSAYHYIQEK